MPLSGKEIIEKSKSSSNKSSANQNKYTNSIILNGNHTNNKNNNKPKNNEFKLFVENSSEEKEYLKNLGIRDFLIYINKRNKQQNLIDNSENNNIFDKEKKVAFKEEQYRSKSVATENNHNLLIQSVNINIENDYIDEELLLKVKGDIKQTNINANKKNSNYEGKKTDTEATKRFFNNIPNKFGNNNIDPKLFQKQNKPNDANNDIFSDDDYKFIEMSKSRKNKFRNSDEQSNFKISAFSNGNESINTAHFNLSKQGNKDKTSNFNNRNNMIYRKKNEEEEQLLLRYYADDYNNIPDSRNTNSSIFQNNSKNVFEENLFNRDNKSGNKYNQSKENSVKFNFDNFKHKTLINDQENESNFSPSKSKNPRITETSGNVNPADMGNGEKVLTLNTESIGNNKIINDF